METRRSTRLWLTAIVCGAGWVAAPVIAAPVPSPSPSVATTHRFNPQTGRLEVVQPGTTPSPAVTMEVSPTQSRYNPVTGVWENVSPNAPFTGQPVLPGQVPAPHDAQPGNGGAGINVQFRFADPSPSPSPSSTARP